MHPLTRLHTCTHSLAYTLTNTLTHSVLDLTDLRHPGLVGCDGSVVQHELVHLVQQRSVEREKERESSGVRIVFARRVDRQGAIVIWDEEIDPWTGGKHTCKHT